MNRQVRRLAWSIVTIAALVWAWTGLGITGGRLDRAGDAIRQLGASAWPPDFSRWSSILDGLVETFQIALLATLIGMALSLPLATLAARNLFPAWLNVPARLVASAVRVLPSLVWAILAVIVLGFGPFAGVAAMTLYTIGYLAKLQYEAFEGIPRDAVDAVRAMGANRFQVAWHVVLPEAANSLRSQMFFMFEYNIRSSTVVGLVGAGGIGQQLKDALDFFAYAEVMAILLVLFATVVLIDAFSYFLRRRFLELDEMEKAPRARWRDLLRFGGPSE